MDDFNVSNVCMMTNHFSCVDTTCTCGCHEDDEEEEED